MISFKHPTPPEPNRKIRKLIDAYNQENNRNICVVMKPHFFSRARVKEFKLFGKRIFQCGSYQKRSFIFGITFGVWCISISFWKTQYRIYFDKFNQRIPWSHCLIDENLQKVKGAQKKFTREMKNFIQVELPQRGRKFRIVQ